MIPSALRKSHVLGRTTVELFTWRAPMPCSAPKMLQSLLYKVMGEFSWAYRICMPICTLLFICTAPCVVQ